MKTLQICKNGIRKFLKENKMSIIISIALLMFGFILLLPCVREFIVSLAPGLIHRKLRKPEKWLNAIFSLGIDIIMLAFIVMVYSFRKKISYTKIFFISILCCFIYTSCSIIISGKFTGYCNIWDFGDFLLPMKRFATKGLYESEYPPMAVCIYKIFYLFLPRNGADVTNALNYNLTFFFFTTIIPLFFLLLFYINGSERKKIYVSIIVFLTGPVLFSYQRGNVILYSLIFLLVFINFYNSQNLVYREAALFSLALAANIKMYPAIFGAVLLKEKKWKESIRTFLYGLFMFVFPSIFSDKGISSVIDFFKINMEFSNNTLCYGWGMSVREWLVRTFIRSHITSLQAASIFLNIIMVSVFLLCLFCFFVAKKRWQGCLMLAYMCILIPAPAYYYNMIFMIIPLTELLNTYDGSFEDKIAAIFFIPMFIYDFGKFHCQPHSVWHIYTLFIFMVSTIIWGHFKRTRDQIVECQKM